MNWATVIGTVILAAVPSLITALPPQYQGALSGIIAGLSAIYHLYQAPPAGH